MSRQSRFVSLDVLERIDEGRKREEKRGVTGEKTLRREEK